jgi:DNA-binding beta-propeller fold protein YncE
MLSKKSRTRIAGTLLCFALWVPASFAANHSLNRPNGLAVDATGNLYVANQGGNQILVYNAAYKQMATKTITQNIHSPIQVALDPQGDVWVLNVDPTNSTSEYFTEFAPTGNQINGSATQNLNNTFTSPLLAIDGTGDVWYTFLNDQPFLAAATPPTAYSGGLLDGIYEQPGSFTALAARGEWVAFGTTTSASWVPSGALLSRAPDIRLFGSSENGAPGVLAMAFDDAANLYIAIYNGYSGSGLQSVNVPAGTPPVLRLSLSYLPSGLAADSAHGRLYISNSSTNQIQVYSTSTWTLLTTIQ